MISRFNLSSIITESYETLEDSLKKRRIAFERTIPPDLPDIVADETEIIQVFNNMLRNAMQSIDEKREHGGTISVVAGFNNETIEIRIKDTGTGISPEVQESIFDFSFSTKTRDMGTGLGLGISRRFVRESDGELILEESTEGVGSTFLITMPIAQKTDKAGENSC